MIDSKCYMSSAVMATIKPPLFLFLPQQVREHKDAMPPTAGEMGRLQTVEEGAGDTVLGAEITSGTSNGDQ